MTAPALVVATTGAGADGASHTPYPASPTSTTEASCQPSGQVNQARSYHGRLTHASTAARTRGSSVPGASGAGRRRSSAWTRRSRSSNRIVTPEQPAQRVAATVNVGLDLGDGDA